MKNGFSSIVTILVSLVLVLIIGATWYFLPKPTNVTLQQPTSTSSASVSLSANESTTSSFSGPPVPPPIPGLPRFLDAANVLIPGWKLFKSDYDGFRFQYPGDFTLSEQTNGTQGDDYGIDGSISVYRPDYCFYGNSTADYSVAVEKNEDDPNSNLPRLYRLTVGVHRLITMAQTLYYPRALIVGKDATGKITQTPVDFDALREEFYNAENGVASPDQGGNFTYVDFVGGRIARYYPPTFHPGDCGDVYFAQYQFFTMDKFVTISISEGAPGLLGGSPPAYDSSIFDKIISTLQFTE